MSAISRIEQQRLPIARYRFTSIADEDLPLPHYSGSLLRGVFGAALRRSTCMTGLPKCSECPLYRTCPYPSIFESPPRETPLGQRFTEVPNPYVIEPPDFGPTIIKRGETLRFGMVLVGSDTLKNLPLITHAWQRALSHGLGRSRARATLTGIEWCGEDARSENVLDQETGTVIPHDASVQIPPCPASLKGLNLAFVTPLRLQSNGKPLRVRELTVRALLLAAVRRSTLMMNLHGGVDPEVEISTLLESSASITDERGGLRWVDWTRYSSRQQQEMTLGGVVGSWKLHGDVEALWPWLWLGQWLHLGKNATMGMGSYTLRLDSAGESSAQSENLPQGASQGIEPE